MVFYLMRAKDKTMQDDEENIFYRPPRTCNWNLIVNTIYHEQELWVGILKHKNYDVSIKTQLEVK